MTVEAQVALIVGSIAIAGSLLTLLLTKLFDQRQIRLERRSEFNQQVLQEPT